MAKKSKRRKARKTLRATVEKFGLQKPDVEMAWRDADFRALARAFSAASSSHELKFFREAGPGALEEKYGSAVKLMLHEAVTFRVASGSYTPDYMAVLEDGRVVFVEVKGSEFDMNLRASRQKVGEAATMYPFFLFSIAFVPIRSGIRILPVAPNMETAADLLLAYSAIANAIGLDMEMNS